MSYNNLMKQSLEKLPPHDLEAERAVLCAAYLDSASLNTVLDIMTPDEFYRGSHAKIFTACQHLVEVNGGVDLLSLRNVLDKERHLEEVGGPAYIAAIADVVPSAANVAYHAKIVHEKAIMRKLLTSSVELATRAYDDKEPATDLIAEARENFEALWRLSFDPETVFWSQDNLGKAKGIDTERFLNFLEKQGYNMLEINETVLFVKDTENILSETTWVKSINKHIKDALKAWCDGAGRRDVWRILVDKGKLFGTQTLTGLDTLQGEFYKDGQENCRIFFPNGAMDITASRVAWTPYSEVKGYIWEDQISEHTYTGRYNRELKRRIYDDMIRAMKARDTATVNLLRLLRYRIQYFEFANGTAHDADIFHIIRQMCTEAEEAMDAAYAHNRKEMIQRETHDLDILGAYVDLQDMGKCEYKRFLELVSAESIEEYTGKHLEVNNLHAFEYAIAYLVHGFNHKANMRAVVLADSNPSFVSNGRRGKGVILQALKHVKGGGMVIKEDGKAFSNGQFKFQLVRPNTRVLILDDVSEDFDFSCLYSAITDGLVVESKGFKRISFPFEDTPRFCITTNHPCYDEGVSSSERAILLPVADYFTNTGKTPYQEFGHMLFDDWDPAEWDRFFDYIVEIVQRYLQRSDPSVIPLVDLTVFNANKLLLKVPEPIVNFLDDLEKNAYHERDAMVKDVEALGFTFKTSQAFNKILHTYCRLSGYYLDKNTKDGRYMSGNNQFYCLKPTTPDLFDAKYQKPKQ